MKILMTTDTNSETWTYAVELIKSLSRYDVHVLLATLGELPTSMQMKEALSLPNISVRCSSHQLEWMEDPWDDIKEAQNWILHLAHDFNPDIIHLNSYTFDGLSFDAPVVMVGHSCVLSWWNAVKSINLPSTWDQYAQFVKKRIQSADIVIATSTAMLDSLKYYYGPFTYSTVIYNGADNHALQFGPKNEMIFSEGKLRDEAKNLQLLMEVAKSIEFPVFIAGENEKTTDYEHLSLNVFLLGKQNSDEIASWLSKAKLYIAPALYEPYGFATLNAAFSGCILILGRIPSQEEIWNDSALYCNPRSPVELIQMIEMVMNDESLQQTLASKAIQKAAEYTADIMGDNYFNLYVSLLNGTTYTIPKIKNEIPINHESRPLSPL